MLGFEIDDVGEAVTIDGEEEEEPLMAYDDSHLIPDSDNKNDDDSDNVWKNIFGERRITISELLQSTPEAEKLKKHNFNLSTDNRWSGGRGNLSKSKLKDNKTKTKRANKKKKQQGQQKDKDLTSNDNADQVTIIDNNDKIDSKKGNSSSPSVTIRSAVPIPNLASSKLSLLDNPNPVQPTITYGKRKLKKMRKEEREKTKGPGWFNLPAAELTEERKNDLDALQLRAALNNKQFYKRNNLATLPKYFQVGRILDNPIDFYRSRIPRKQRKRTIAEEMMAEVSASGIMERGPSSSKNKRR